MSMKQINKNTRRAKIYKRYLIVGMFLAVVEAAASQCLSKK